MAHGRAYAVEAVVVIVVIVRGEATVGRVHARQVLFLVAFAADFVLGRFLVRDVLLLFPLGAPILEPDLHLGLRDVQERGDFGAFTRR